MKLLHPITGSWVLLLGLLVLPPSCKDKEPCDDDQDSIGTGCFDKPMEEPMSNAGSPPAEGGAPSSGSGAEGGSSEPAGNPDAMFKDPCKTDADCGGPAPICLVKPGPEYCSQIDCEEGEEHAGECPDGWVCFKLNAETRSACLSTN